MVIRVPPQPEPDMLGYAARELLWKGSKLIQADALGPGTSLWRCALSTSPGLGFWIGYLKDDGDAELHAYLLLMPRALDQLAVLEAKKGWTEPKWRRRGLSRALLAAACSEAPVVSDFDGMTSEAYQMWDRAPGFTRRWWDDKQGCFVSDATVPTWERFDAYPPAERWQIVMELAGAPGATP